MLIGYILRPLTPPLGMLPLGANATLKPCFTASRNRSSPLGTGRTSPDKPNSPKTTQSFAIFLPLKLESKAATTAKSPPVSITRNPPTILTKTSWSNKEQLPWRFRIASSMANRFWSIPTVILLACP